jgi:hypothetical protein
MLLLASATWSSPIVRFMVEVSVYIKFGRGM